MYFFNFRTSKSKRAIRLGLSVLWRKGNAPRVSSTNLELLKFLLKKRKVNSGKPEADVKNQTFSRFDFPGEKENKQTLIYFEITRKLLLVLFVVILSL